MTVPGRFVLQHIAERVLNTPLMITETKLETILSFLGPRIGLEVPALPAGYEAVTDFSVSQRFREESDDGIGLIPIHGTLVHRASGFDGWSGITSYEWIRSIFDEAMADRSIQTVLLDIDSSGGEVAGVFDLVDHIYQSRGTKAIYAVANESALSAAYAIASAADRVFLPRTGLAGSVGVRMVHVDQSGWDEKLGVKYTVIFAGDRKNDFSPHEPLSDAALQVARRIVGETYDLFVRTVARNRNLSEADVRRTEAAIFHGEHAVSAGLADGVKNFGEVIETISGGGNDMKLFSKKDKPRIEEPEIEEREGLSVGPMEEPEAGAPDLDRVRNDGMEAGLAAGLAQGRKETLARVVAICDLCEASDPHFPVAALRSLILEEDASVEEIRERIMRAAAERSDATEIFSTVSAMSTGAGNPLIADARRRAGSAGKGA